MNASPCSNRPARIRNINVLLRKITFDFELGLLLQFLTVNIHGCFYYYYSQSILRKGQKLRLQTMYRDDPTFKGLCHQNGSSIFLSWEVRVSSMNRIESWGSGIPSHRGTREPFCKHLTQWVLSYQHLELPQSWRSLHEQPHRRMAR